MIRDGQDRRFSQNTGQDEKANSVDLVTECDQAVEKFLIEKIKAEYPEHKLCVELCCGQGADSSIGEESYDGQVITAAPTWIGELLRT